MTGTPGSRHRNGPPGASRITPLHEIRRRRAFQILSRDGELPMFIKGDGPDRVTDVPRKTGTKVGAVLQTQFAEEFLAARFIGHPGRRARHAKNLVELVGFDSVDKNLVWNAPKKRFIGELIRGQIGGENNLQLERDVELAAAAERKKVDAAIERHDPAVEQIPRRNHLASEVVDQQDSVVGLHLQRGAVGAAGLVLLQIEHAGDEFSANGYERPPADGPARVYIETSLQAGLNIEIL